MKTKLNILLLGITITFFISCDNEFLEPVPDSVLSSANYYTTPEEVENSSSKYI